MFNQTFCLLFVNVLNLKTSQAHGKMIKLVSVLALKERMAAPRSRCLFVYRQICDTIVLASVELLL